MARSRPRARSAPARPPRFELGQHLHRPGIRTTPFAGSARRTASQPDNWTYKRQAWSLADPFQGPTEAYDSDWLTDVRKLGAENYYPPFGCRHPATNRRDSVPRDITSRIAGPSVAGERGTHSGPFAAGANRRSSAA